jgi:hypothetical protein
MPGRAVLGRAKFHDPERPPVSFFDIASRPPEIHQRVYFTGLQALAAERIPLAIAEEDQGSLPGQPFGSAVIRALAPEVLQALFHRRGEALTDTEVDDLMAPVLRLVAQGKLVLAGVGSPPSPDPEYQAFAPTMLSHWSFVPGEDVAVPRVAGGLTFVSLRVFTLMEFAFVERSGRKLRPLARVGATDAIQLTSDVERAPATEAVASSYRTGAAGRPSSVALVIGEMKRRHAAGELQGSLAQEAKALVHWLQGEHPLHPPLKPKSAENAIRNDYRLLRRSPASTT